MNHKNEVGSLVFADLERAQKGFQLTYAMNVGAFGTEEGKRLLKETMGNLSAIQQAEMFVIDGVDQIMDAVTREFEKAGFSFYSPEFRAITRIVKACYSLILAESNVREFKAGGIPKKYQP